MAGVRSGVSEWEILATNLRVQSALLEVLGLLDGLPVIVFKGPILTESIYQDLRCRASADNDLYLPGPDAELALERLLAAGYLPVEGLDPRAALADDGQVALWPERDFKRVSVDLHRRPFHEPFFDVPHDVIAANLRQVNVQGAQVTTFNLQLAFLHQVAHFVQHLLERSHLPVIGASWDAWGEHLGGPDFERLVAETCGREALDYCLALTSAHRLSSRPVPSDRRQRARMALGVWGPLRDDRGEPPRRVVRKALALWLVAPTALPSAITRRTLLRPDDLQSRYGAGPRPWQLVRHIRHILGER